MSPTCFLIDDDTDEQEIFELALGEVDKSIQLFFANNSTEALSKLTNDKGFIPHYIFLDLNMPVMNGKQVLTEIKKLPHLINTPIVIYSTSADDKDILETKQLGAADYVIKPSAISSLTKILTRFFKK